MGPERGRLLRTFRPVVDWLVLETQFSPGRFGTLSCHMPGVVHGLRVSLKGTDTDLREGWDMSHGQNSQKWDYIKVAHCPYQRATRLYGRSLDHVPYGLRRSNISGTSRPP